jgi:hypothetical protein
MDRRYAEMQLNGLTASTRNQQRSDALVSRYLNQARVQNRRAQHYGGSTGSGSNSAFKGDALQTVRADSRQMDRAVFDDAGSGALGGGGGFQASRAWSRQSRGAG